MLHLAYPDFFEEEYYLKNFTKTLDNQVSPLHHSILNERIYLLQEQLEDFSMNVNILNKNYETPLLAATKLENTKTSLELISKLLENDADLNIGDYHGNTPLHEIVKSENTKQTSKILDLFLKNPKRQVNVKNHLGETPLHVVKHFNMAEKLIENGAEINIVDYSGNTPLHKQVINFDIMKILIEKGANIDVKNVNKLTALHEAIIKNQEMSVKFLLKNGASVNKMVALQMGYMSRCSDNIKEMLWERSESLYLMFVVMHDQTKFDKILDEWSTFYKKEDEVVNFISELLSLLRKVRDSKRISCQRIVAEFFIKNIDNISLSKCKFILKKFTHVFSRSLLNFILRTHNYSNSDESFKYIQNLVKNLISKGEKPDYSDLEVIYLQFGDSTLLHYLIKFKPNAKARKLKEIPLFPKILCNPTINLTDLLKSKTVSKVEVQDFFDIHNLARYCTLPQKLYNNFFDTYKNLCKNEQPPLFKNGMEKCLQEIRKNCKVPSLMEMCRNIVRPTISKKYKIYKSHDLYEILDKIAVPKPLISVIMMEAPLHLHMKIPNYCPYAKHTYLL